MDPDPRWASRPESTDTGPARGERGPAFHPPERKPPLYTGTLRCGTRHLDLARCHVMGVLNVTPDSFSDGGRWYSAAESGVARQKALEHARRMVAEGATIIDIGGESTRPGAAAPSVQEEMDRVLPLVEHLSGEVDAVISVDSSTPELMAEAIRLGAGMINDVRALRRAGALEAAAAGSVAVCLMHMQGEPGNMQADPVYTDVVEEVERFLRERVAACMEAGIPRDRIVVDPGFGFGKTLDHNLTLLAHLDRFLELGQPLLVGMSRKSMIGAVLDRPVGERLHGSTAVALIAAMRGANIIRVHDVAPTVDGLRMFEAVRNAE